MTTLLSTFENDVFQKWNTGISRKMTQSLNRSLILRDEKERTLRVNIGKELMSVLREVKKLS